MKTNTKEIGLKALKTFLQAAVGYLCAMNLMELDWSSRTAVAGVVLAAISAGLAALMNIDWDNVGKPAAAMEDRDENQ